METIDSFTKTAGYFWLSNFYECDIFGYGSTEAYYQACKTLDIDKRINFKFMSPKESKEAGRKLKLRDDWEVIKDYVMFSALQEKFKDKELAQKLLDTYPKMLVEGNTWHDNYWGDCYCLNDNPSEKNILAHPDCLYAGKNMLGHQLMIVREITCNTLC